MSVGNGIMATNMTLQTVQETLAEIPTQLLQYYKMKGIQPRTPLQRQGTSYLVSGAASDRMANALDVEV